MITLKSIAAVYVGLYLVLPACLCQLLAAFGCGIHTNSVATDLQPIAEISAAVIYVTPECHCDDHVSKTAEALMSAPDSVDHFDLVLSSVVVQDVMAVDRGLSVDLYPRGPPPGSPVWSLSPYSGVYRI